MCREWGLLVSFRSVFHACTPESLDGYVRLLMAIVLVLPSYYGFDLSFSNASGLSTGDRASVICGLTMPPCFGNFPSRFHIWLAYYTSRHFIVEHNHKCFIFHQYVTSRYSMWAYQSLYTLYGTKTPTERERGYCACGGVTEDTPSRINPNPNAAAYLPSNANYIIPD